MPRFAPTPTTPRKPARFATLAAVGPLVALLLVLGCPRTKQDAPDAAPSTSSSASAAVPPPSALPTAEAGEPDTGTDPLWDEDDAGLALGDADDGGDARSETGDAKVKSDAYDDAPLLGAKTFPDENPVRGLRKITVPAARVHKAPKDQTIIATLQKGTEITLVAEIFEWYRVRYTDPNTNVRRQGWLYVSTFAGPKMKSCPDGWNQHAQGWCEKECNKNTDCKALKGYKCSGTGCFYAAD